MFGAMGAMIIEHRALRDYERRCADQVRKAKDATNLAVDECDKIDKELRSTRDRLTATEFEIDSVKSQLYDSNSTLQFEKTRRVSAEKALADREKVLDDINAALQNSKKKPDK
jgi:chromosome condensin MukBEF ATPase and DNA-binding subunit MukB